MNLQEKLSKYPKLGGRTKLSPNQHPLCWICGKEAKYKLEIQVNFFRGDDETVKACEEHKNMLEKP